MDLLTALIILMVVVFLLALPQYLLLVFHYSIGANSLAIMGSFTGLNIRANGLDYSNRNH